jgi:hypothetical protein
LWDRGRASEVQVDDISCWKSWVSPQTFVASDISKGGRQPLRSLHPLPLRPGRQGKHLDKQDSTREARQRAAEQKEAEQFEIAEDEAKPKEAAEKEARQNEIAKAEADKKEAAEKEARQKDAQILVQVVGLFARWVYHLPDQEVTTSGTTRNKCRSLEDPGSLTETGVFGIEVAGAFRAVEKWRSVNIA